MPVYRVQYLREGVPVGSSPHSGTLDSAKQFARDGLIRHDADIARILDEVADIELDSVVRDT